ncbi:MAG TPA: hypothetical protein VG944_24465 [Fimbriimonas sp.]|nr:hypothetical protein [Fimbriimonas sp.]
MRIDKFRYVDTDARTVFRHLFKEMHVAYSLSPKVKGRISVALYKVPFTTALKWTCIASNSTFIDENGVYSVVPKAGSDCGTLRNDLEPQSFKDPSDHPIKKMHVVNADFQPFMSELLINNHVPFVIGVGLKSKVSVEIREGVFADALSAACHSASASYRVHEGIVEIMAREPDFSCPKRLWQKLLDLCSCPAKSCT